MNLHVDQECPAALVVPALLVDPVRKEQTMPLIFPFPATTASSIQL